MTHWRSFKLRLYDEEILSSSVINVGMEEVVEVVDTVVSAVGDVVVIVSVGVIEVGETMDVGKRCR